MMNMPKIFIDGQEGTTGLQIHERLKARKDLTLLEIDPALRKDLAERKRLLNEADLAILCLPDDAAKESVALIENPTTRVVDASTAHRTAPGWVYGMAELAPGQREAIKKAKRVTNPGCYATGFIALMRPLIARGVVAPTLPVHCFALSGYSGAGKKLIAVYEGLSDHPELLAPRPYALGLRHKHLPEMKQWAQMESTPLFLPVVGPYHHGMAVTVPFFTKQLVTSQSPDTIHAIYAEYYKNEPFVKVIPLDSAPYLDGVFLSPVDCNGTNRLDIFVFGHAEQVAVCARLDNLGKGASGAAVQNLNLMLGLPEDTGLQA